MKMVILTSILCTFYSLAWEKISRKYIVEDKNKMTIINEDGYEGGAYSTPPAIDATKPALSKEDTYENGAYAAPAVMKDPISSRATD